MKKSFVLPGDTEIQSGRSHWSAVALILFALAPAVEGIAQKTPALVQTPRDATVARISAPDTRGKPGMIPQGAASIVLSAISTAEENGKLVVSVSTNGSAEYKAFTLSQPRRLVVDFINAQISVSFRELPVNLASVKQIRLSQIKEADTRIARLVFDLEDVKRVNHQIITEGQTVKILFPSTQTATATQTKPSSAVKSDTAAKPETSPAKTPAAKAAAPKPAPTPVTPKPEVLVARAAAAPLPQPTPASEPVAAAKTPSQDKPAAVPKPGPPAAKAAPPTPAPKPAPASAAAAPVRAKSTQASAPSQKIDPPVLNAALATKPRPAPPAAPKATAGASQPLEVAEIPAARRFNSGANREVPAPAPPASIRPAQQAPPNPPSPVPQAQPAPAPAPASQAPTPEGRFAGAPLTLDLIDIPLVDFFRLMAEEGGINIVIDPEIRGTISIKVVKVPWDQILEAALINNGLDKQIEGNLVRIAKKSTLQQEAKQREDLKKANMLAADVETRLKRLNYAKASGFVPALTEMKSVRGTVVVDERTNALILTDIPSFLEKMLKLIESLDIPQPQVEIEARIVSANRDFARDLGIQFGFVQGNLRRTTIGGPNTFGTIGGTRPSQTPTSGFVAGDSSTGRGASENKASQSAGVSTGTSTQNAGNFNVNLPATRAFGGLGVSVGNIFDVFLLDAAITAGESKGLAKLISQPKVTAQNNSPAQITQGLRFPVQIVANNTISVQFQNAALTLIVTPQITLESNIVLDLSVENNTPDFSRSVNGIPSIRTSESKTRVLVTDGGTTVIGGIIIETESNQADRVPGLASLPGIGNLFKRTSVGRTSQEVLFFITPKIIK